MEGADQFNVTPELHKPVARFAGTVITAQLGTLGNCVLIVTLSNVAGGLVPKEPSFIHEKTKRWVVPAKAGLSVME